KSNISAEKIADATGRISKAVESAGAISDDNRKMSELALEKIGREADKVAREVGRFREIAGEFGSEKAGLFGASREIAALVAELASKISAEKDGFIKSVSDVREVTEKTTGSIRSSAGEIVATTSNIKDAIGEINSLMADSSRNLGAQAGAAMKFASEIKATLKSQVEDLEAVVNSVSAQTRLGEVSIEKQGEKLAEIAEGLFAKIDAMNGRISGTINGLLGLADKIDGRFRDMNENIVARTTSASKIIADHLESAGAQSASFKEFSAAFSSEVARANSEIAALVAALKEQTFGLETATKSARDLVAGVSAEIVKARGIMPELASNMGSVGASLEKSMSQIEDAVKNAGAKRAELVENLNKVAAYFTDFASKKASEIEFVSASGTKAMTNVASYASKLASEAQGTIDAFNRQYRDMLALSEAASKKVAGIMENIGGVKDVSAPATIATEEFLNQTGYVIEKLNSLSIDLAQILTPDINQDLWNKYNAGHRGVFSKYLSSALTKKQTASIRELAKSNSGFRNYVRTFVGEFDSLMLKARATDKSEILLSTITSTDVGKVYMIIKEVLS
ncbi:MAG: hypothetical protein LBO78_02515, partial [Rickettsiales bacterium]|nr:hypothetical protein [Rickettsiales bacterium]